MRRKSGFTYEIVTPDDHKVATIQRKFKTFGVKLTMGILDTDPPIDRRLLVAANVIMAQRAFEKKKKC